MGLSLGGGASAPKKHPKQNSTFGKGKPMGAGTWQAVRVAMPSGMMIASVLGVAKLAWGWSPSPMAIVIAASVACAVGLVAVFVIAKRTPFEEVAE